MLVLMLAVVGTFPRAADIKKVEYDAWFINIMELKQVRVTARNCTHASPVHQ
jgi:hypothetical protein